MPVFEYAGYDAGGRAKKGMVEADTMRAAKQRLRGQGVFVKNIKESQAKSEEKITRVPVQEFFQRVAKEEVVLMTRQLATLVSAHIPLVSGLGALAEQTEGVKLKTIIAQLKDDVNEGASLAAAMRQHANVFPSLYTNMIAAGEASGALDVVLLRLADFMENQDDLRRRVRGALTYPIVVMVIALGVVFFLMTTVVPKVLTIFDAQRRTLPLPTRILQFMSHAIAGYWWLVIALVAGAVWGIRKYMSTPEGRRRWDEISLELPIFGNVARKVAVARFARTLSTLLSAGIPLLQAMDITKNVVDNVVIESALNEARDNISEGASLSSQLKQSGVFPPMVTHMISVGESSGELEQMLVRVADTYENEVRTVLDSMTSLLQPIIIVVLAVVVGFIAVAVLMPIFQLSQGLKH
ncbi:MAG: type II secretion system inner membrane protein GspF [Chrysiogenetes bacterium]|nr:type II secretion system inner membrane protein GspF [Chrysiogenetes bacterium]